MDLATARQVLNDISIDYCTVDSFVKSKKIDVVQTGIQESDYVSMQELQETFGISRYHLVKYLKAIKATPIGERKNYIDGKRTRGVGKVVYPRATLSEVKTYLSNQSDIEAIRQMARKILEC